MAHPKRITESPAQYDRFLVLTPHQAKVITSLADEVGYELRNPPCLWDGGGILVSDDDLGALADIRPGLIAMLRLPPEYAP